MWRLFRICFCYDTRGHAYKLYKPRCTSAVRYNFFTERVIDVWNDLPLTVNFASLTFRRSIEDVDFTKYIKSTSWFYHTVYKFLFCVLLCIFVDLSLYSRAVVSVLWTFPSSSPSACCFSCISVLFERNKMYVLAISQSSSSFSWNDITQAYRNKTFAN